MKNYILTGCILLLTISLFFPVKEGADNENTQNNEPQVPEKLRALDEVYKKKLYETVSEIVSKGLNEEFIKTPACKAECVLDEEKIRRSLSVIDQAHVVLIISFLYNLLNDDASLKFITGMLGPNSKLVNRPPINVTKEELRVIVIIIKNLKKNKNFMSLLNKVNNSVKT